VQSSNMVRKTIADEDWEYQCVSHRPGPRLRASSRCRCVLASKVRLTPFVLTLSQAGLRHPRLRLGDANHMKDQKQGHQERRNQAQWQHCHGSRRWAVRTKQRGGSAEKYCCDQVGNPKCLPKNKTTAMIGIGQLPCNQSGCCPNGHVTVSGGQGKHTG